MDKKNIESVNIALIIHPLNREIFNNNFFPFYKPISYIAKPIMKLLSPFLIKKLYTTLQPHKFMHIKGIKINDKKLVSIIGIMCPLFPEQIVSNERESIKKVINAALKAQRAGADIIALAGFTSIIGNEGEEVAKNIDVAVTSGNTLTASLSLEGIFRAVEITNKNLEDCRATVVGATGDIGSICSIVLSKKVKTLVLCARNIENSNLLINRIREKSKANILFEKSARKAVNNSDIIITASSSFTTLIEAEDLKTGAIFCDVSMPPNIGRNIVYKRKDIFVFEGGRAKFDFFDKINNEKWKSLFPTNAIYGCLSEAFVLAIEGKFKNFSIGRGNITENKMNEINMLAKKNGIYLSDFYLGDKKYSNKDFERLKNT